MCPAKKIKILLLTACVLLSHANMNAGGFQTGTFHSPKGFGFCFDHPAVDGIINSYILYADLYGIWDGSKTVPGIKLVYLHQNRLLAFRLPETNAGLFIAPGFSTGYVTDRGKEGHGIVTAADISLSIRFSFEKAFELEAGFLLELGFFSQYQNNYTSTQLYENGLRNAARPHIKLLYRFR